MAKTLHERLCGSLQARSVWEERNRIWYAMSHDGLKRRRKPFPGAADLHLPIADNAVQKLLPFYLNSIFSRPQLASFTPLRLEQGEASADASQALDWKLRKESNFPTAMAQVLYLMLTYSGKIPMKTRWDPQARGGQGGLAFEAIDPLFFIPQPGADCIDEMDWFAHIKQTTVGKYLRSKLYTKKDAEFVQRIRGGEKQEEAAKMQEKANREGLTYSKDDEEIILWECYQRTGRGWKVVTFSPSAPDDPVRDDFMLGWMWQGEPLQPFTEFYSEIGEKGFYAPRGIVEKVAAFETYGTKMWNQKADWLEYAAKPLFTRDKDAALTNPANITMGTGQVLPPGVAPAAMPAPPFSLDEEIANTRQLAEESAQVPDFGAQNAEEGGKDNRTATEWNYIGSFASQGIQHKAWISSLSEGQLYKKAWALLVRFGGKELAFFAAKSRKVVPGVAMHDHYLIEPDAQPDAWNKTQRVQRSFSRFQLLRNDPRINQDELYSDFLSSDDPRLVKKLYVNSGQKAASEAEDEAMEIAILMEGYPAQPMPGENHQLRIQMLMGKLQALSMMPPPMTEAEMMRQGVARQRLHEHIAAHVAMMQQENPQGAKQITDAIGVLDESPAGMPDDMNGSGGLAGGLPSGDPRQSALPAPGPGQIQEGMAI